MKNWNARCNFLILLPPCIPVISFHQNFFSQVTTEDFLGYEVVFFLGIYMVEGERDHSIGFHVTHLKYVFSISIETQPDLKPLPMHDLLKGLPEVFRHLKTWSYLIQFIYRKALTLQESRFWFWDAMSPWIQQHDYNLYTYLKKKPVNVYVHIPRQNLKAFRNSEWPFAHLGGDTPDEEIPNLASWPSYNVTSPSVLIILHFTGDTRDVYNFPRRIKANMLLSSWSRAISTINRLLNEWTSTYNGPMSPPISHMWCAGNYWCSIHGNFLT